MNRARTPHILSTSSNLLGFCLIVMTSLRIANRMEENLIDEFTAAAALLFVTSCLLSFLSMRTANEARGERLERRADLVFLGGLLLVFITIVLIAFNFIV